jgi:hypothetical protein
MHGMDRGNLETMLSRFALLLVLCVFLAACRAGSAPPSGSTPAAVPGKQPEKVAWDAEPSALVLRLYSPYTTAGLAGAYDRRYYIPEVQLWGDGRIIWVEREGVARRVLEGQLAPEQMKALLQQIVDAGFFAWEDAYQTLGGNSMPPMVLQVNLAGRSKEMSEHGGAPPAYYGLEELLRRGAGAVGHDYVPARGYLSAEPLSVDLGGEPWPVWATITPDEVAQGATIRGEILAYVWELVNRNPTVPVYVAFEGQTYTIVVQIPGLSFFEPPLTRSSTWLRAPGVAAL